MAVNISKLWGLVKFKKLNPNSKLLYIYLSNNPYINSVGVINVKPDDVADNLGITLEEVRIATTELRDKNMIYVKKVDGEIYFIIPRHFSTVNNSAMAIEKMRSDFKSMPSQLNDYLNSIGITITKKAKILDKPTYDQILEFSLGEGFYINPNDVIDYYDRISEAKNTPYWVDRNGAKVIDWKSKLKKVWFKNAKPIIIAQGAPEGFEYFHVIIDHKPYFPERWVDGKPRSSDFLTNKKLNDEFKRRKNNS